MKPSRLILALVAALTLSLGTNAFADDEKWISLFDGKTLDGWEKVGNEKSVWEVQEGSINGSGPASMLVSTKGPYKNFRYHAEIKINDHGNSGLYFRTTPKPGFTDGYEAQIDSTHTDPIRTGSIYGMCHVYSQLVKPDTWFTYDLEVRDDIWRGREMTRIKVTVDDRVSANFKPAWCICHTRCLQWTGRREGMSLCGACLLVRSADNGNTIHKFPMIWLGN